MTTSEAHVFDKTLTTSLEWVGDVMVQLQTSDPAKALRALRAALHALRDRLPAAEVVDLGAQLPMLIRGLYYEGWRLDQKPARVRSRRAFLSMVERELRDESIDPQEALRAVVQVLAWRISEGELDDIAGCLPKQVAELWSEGLA